MRFFERHRRPKYAALAVGAALIGGGFVSGGPATPAAGTTTGGDPTITVRVGGIRTGENGAGVPSALGLAGATFSISPASAGNAATCTSSAAGQCTFNVSSDRTYTITQTGAPAGWYDNPALGAGSITPSTVTARPYRTLSVAVQDANVTVPVAAGNTTATPTARSGTWALSKDNPPLPNGCGLKIAMVFDLSASVTGAILPTYKAAGRAFVDALKGTPSSIGIYTFGTHAPAVGATNTTLVPPVPVTTQAGVTTLNSKINALRPPDGAYTNWDAAIWQVARDEPAYGYQAAVVLTDGDPTRYGPSTPRASSSGRPRSRLTTSSRARLSATPTPW